MVRATKVHALTILLAVFWTAVALGAPRDKAAQQKIDEAIFTHFLNTDFDTAEGLLLGTLRACEDKCSPEIKGKAWMYVGVIRGVGRKDLDGAEEAFHKAIEQDPGAQLDTQVANDEVKAAWANVQGGGAPPGAAGASGNINCGLDASAVQSRRPIPLACGSTEELSDAKLHYQGPGQDWREVGMNRIEGEWLATIPCSATGATGNVNWYVEGFDDNGDLISTGGSSAAPNTVEIVDETDEAAPAYPGEEPPARCSEGGAGPAGGQCGGWSEPCGANDCCDTGLSCREGLCEPVQCVDNSECDAGKCVNNKCETQAKGTAKKNWLSLSFGMDFASVGSEGACTPESRTNDDYSCFLPDGSTYFGEPSQAAPGAINGAFTLATMRLLVGYERLFGPIGAQLRLGFAFNGGQTPQGGTGFVPIHAEARGKYWFRGEKGFDTGGFLPFIQLGFGFAQVDGTVKTGIVDCGRRATDGSLVRVDDAGMSTTVPEECLTATDEQQAQDANHLGRAYNVEATKRLGKTFITGGLGFLYAIGQRHGPVLNLNFLYLFPSSGVVLQPNVGYSVGF